MNVNYFASKGISVQDGSLPCIEWLSRDHILLEMRYSLARPLGPRQANSLRVASSDVYPAFMTGPSLTPSLEILLPPPTVSDANFSEDAVNLPTFSLALAIISLKVPEPMSERKPTMR